MKVGDLVKIKRVSIGIPTNIIGMVIQDCVTGSSGIGYWNVQLIGGQLNGRTRRFLTQDLAKINV